MSELLVVEDEANIRRFVAINLTARGFKVIEAGDAEEGLQKLRANPPEALILDIRLPNMSGWDLLEAIAGEPTLATLPVIVMTASATNIKFGESHYTNVVQWLVKPISAGDLVLAVKKALEH